MQRKPVEWITWIGTRHRMPGLPRLLYVSLETRSSPDYRAYGKNRRIELQSILQIGLSGRGCLEDSRGIRIIEPGQCFFCKANDPSVSYWYPEDGRIPWRFIYIGFEGADAILSGIEVRGGRVWTAPDSVVRRLMRFQCGHEQTTVIEALDGIRIVVDTLADLVAADSPGLSGKQRLSKTVQSIRDLAFDISEPVGTVAEIVLKLGLSREHLSRAFHREYGMPLQRFLDQCRLRRICQALREMEGNEMKEIAYRFGFSSPSNFTRWFKRVASMSPLRFLRENTLPLASRIPGDRRFRLPPDVSPP